MIKIISKYGLLITYITSISCLLLSCGSMRVYVNQDTIYSRKNPITINQSSDDNSGTLGELQFLLQSNGYKLMSYGAAKKAFNLDSQTQSGSYHGEITNTTTFNSIYVMDLNYSYYYDLLYWAYTSFSATITDLKSGEIIMTANFRGDKSVRAVLNELVKKMNAVIKN
jgi:hypothetical protein